MKFNIAFVIPCYNEEANIGACIESILSEAWKERSLVNAHLLVVDNASTDKTSELAGQYGVWTIIEPKKGITHARQAGFKLVQMLWPEVQYIAYIDADNTIPEGWLRTVTRSFDRDTVMVTGPHYYRGWSSFMHGVTGAFYMLGRLSHKALGAMSMGGNNVVKVSALDRIGGYPTDCEFYGEDTAFAQSIAKIGKIKVIPELWVWSSPRRMAEEGVVKTTFRYVSNYLSVVLRGKAVTTSHLDIRP